MAGWEESKVDSNSERGEGWEGLEGSRGRGMIKKWDTWGVEERCEAEKGGGGVKEGGKKNGTSKGGRKIFCHDLTAEKKGGGIPPQDSEPISFLHSATFFYFCLRFLHPPPFFITIVAFITLMAQFYFRFSTLSAAPPP